MADDLRERQPDRDLGDNPPEDGIRSDIGASAGAGGAGSGGVAAGGPAIRRAANRVADAGTDEGGEPPRDPLSDVEHPTADE